MTRVSRRRLLTLLWAAPAGVWALASGERARAQGLGKFMNPSDVACTNDPPTPSAADSAAPYRAGAPARTSLVEPGMTGQALVIRGVVAGVKCGAIAGAIVDFWQADTQGRYDATGWRLHGRQTTGPKGEYELRTIVPGRVDGRVPHIDARVAAPANKATLVTTLFLATVADATHDPQFKPALALKLDDDAGGKTGIFKFLLDL
jgi:protocatechuate 3,4-dioxygenase beta subunit